MISRLDAKHTGAVKVFPLGNERSGFYDVTVLNLSGSGGIELVDAEDKVVGEGFPLAHGAAWDSTIAGAEELWAVTAESSEVPFVVSATLAG